MVTGVPDWHRELHDALIALTDLTALLVENLVVQQVGLQKGIASPPSAVASTSRTCVSVTSRGACFERTAEHVT